MYFFIWIGIILIFAVAVIIGVFANDGALKKERKEQIKLNADTLEKVKAEGFVVSRIFYLTDYSTFNKPDDCKKILAVDTENKKLLLMDYSSKTHYVVNFNELLSYELYENSSMVTEGLGGGFGVGYFGGETKGMVRDLKLIIRLKSIAHPQVAYTLVSKTTLNMGIAKTSPVYRSISPALQEVVSLLEVIKNENKE